MRGFSYVGVELGHFLGISPTTLNKINLTEAWLKADIENMSEMPTSLQVNFSNGACLIEVEILSSFKVPLRAFTGFSSQCSSHGSCYRSPSSEPSSPPVSMESDVGSVGGEHFDHTKPASSSGVMKSPCKASCKFSFQLQPHDLEPKLPVNVLSSPGNHRRNSFSSAKLFHDLKKAGRAFHFLPSFRIATDMRKENSNFVVGMTINDHVQLGLNQGFLPQVSNFVASFIKQVVENIVIRHYFPLKGGSHDDEEHQHTCGVKVLSLQGKKCEQPIQYGSGPDIYSMHNSNVDHQMLISGFNSMESTKLACSVGSHDNVR